MKSYSNTTFVKVKFTAAVCAHVAAVHSNTTFVKVKSTATYNTGKSSTNSNTTFVKVKLGLLKHIR